MRSSYSSASRFAGLLCLCAAAASGQTPAAPSTPAAAAPGPPELPAMVRWHDTPSGLQYAELVVGRGAPPREGQIAVVHFNGWLDSGAQFDSTYQRKPFGFPLGGGQVIQGWDEGVRGMRPGGKRRLIVPPQLGYGPQGVPGLVPPNATLVFDIELLRVAEPPPPPPPPTVHPEGRRRK